MITLFPNLKQFASSDNSGKKVASDTFRLHHGQIHGFVISSTMWFSSFSFWLYGSQDFVM